LQDIQYLKEKKIFTKYTCYVSVFFILVVWWKKEKTPEFLVKTQLEKKRNHHRLRFWIFLLLEIIMLCFSFLIFLNKASTKIISFCNIEDSKKNLINLILESSLIMIRSVIFFIIIKHLIKWVIFYLRIIKKEYLVK
jgi:hypothetical protein